MTPEIIISRHNHGIDPHLSEWGFEVPLDLFLGGFAAGLFILAAFMHLRRKDKEYPFLTGRATVFAPVFLAAGVFFLWLDLAHRWWFWNLYLTFEWTSPMSWGTWALSTTLPVSFFFALMKLSTEDRGWITQFISKLPAPLVRLSGLVAWLFGLADRFRTYADYLAWYVMIVGGFVGIYTGILLSAFSARPFWNTPVMGIMFLASGISVASAFVAMMTDHKEEERSMTTVSLSALLVEIFLMVQIFVQYMSSGQNHADAGAMIFGGPYTGIFWMVAMFQGLFFPLFMLIMQIKGVFYFKRITPLSVLFGGLLLRFIIVWLGQISEVRLDM